MGTLACHATRIPSSDLLNMAYGDSSPDKTGLAARRREVAENSIVRLAQDLGCPIWYVGTAMITPASAEQKPAQSPLHAEFPVFNLLLAA